MLSTTGRVRRLAMAACGAVSMLASPTGGAQESMRYASGSNSTSYEISLTLLHQNSVNVDRGGDFTLSSAFVRFGAKRTISSATSVGLSLKYDVDDYDFAGGPGDAAPWNDVRRFGIGLPIFTRFANDWSLGLSPAVDWLREDGADGADALSYGVTVFAFKSLDRDHSLGLGAGVFRTIDDETRVFPFVAVDWRFNERWRLANPFEADALGPAGLELSYGLSQRWTLSGGGVFRSFRFRLDGEGAAPGGIGENEGIAAFLRLQRTAAAGLELDLYAGAMLNGRLELTDAAGAELSSSGYDPAPFIAATLGRSF